MHEVPHLTWAAGVSLAVLVLQVVLLIRARRQRALAYLIEDSARTGNWAPAQAMRLPSLLNVVAAGGSVLFIPALTALSLHAAHARTLNAIACTDPLEKAERFSTGLNGTMGTVLLSISVLIPIVLLSLATAGLFISARLRMRHFAAAARLASSDGAGTYALLQHQLPTADDVAMIPAAFFAFGLMPVIAGAWGQATLFAHGFSALADRPAEEKAALFAATIDRAQAASALCASLALPGTLLACLVSVLLQRRWARTSAAASSDTAASPSWRFTAAVGLPCGVAALVCFQLAAPFRAEDRLPWPPMSASDGAILLPPDAVTSALVGPDQVERGPLCEISDSRARLDARVVELQELADELVTAKNNFKLLHPTTEFRGTFLVLCEPRTSIARLGALLSTAARSGYLSPQFLFIRREIMNRPILGQLTLLHPTAVRALLPDPYDDETGPVEPLNIATFADCEQFARNLIDLRRSGKKVTLALPRPANDEHAQ